MHNSIINSREGDKRSNKLLFCPKRQFKDNMRLPRVSARFRTGMLKNNQMKSRKKGGDKSAVAILKDVRQLTCVFQDTEPPASLTILREEHNKSGNQFVEDDSQKLRSVTQTSEKTKDHCLVKYNSNFFITANPYAMKFRKGLRK